MQIQHKRGGRFAGWVVTAITLAVVAGLFAVDNAAADAVPTPKTPAVAPLDSGLAASTSRLHLIQQLRDAAAAQPDRFGGVATSGDSTVMLCDKGGPASAAETAVGALRAAGARVAVQPCAHSLAELNRVLAAAPSAVVFSESGVTLTRWGIDYDHNAVEIGVDSAPPGLAEKVATLWGGAAYLSVKKPLDLQTGSRTADFPPFFGGDLIGSAGSTCTSGFTLTNLYGTRYSITAGHCYGLNSTVTTNGWNMGAVNFRTWGGRQNDAELIGGGSYAGKVWIGGAGNAGNTWMPVHGAENSCNGCYVWENGAITGQTLVQLSGYPYCDNLAGVISCNVQDTYSTGAVACHGGDSGNPVFAYNGRGGVTAIGIHHSGDGVGYCAYTQIPPILSYWTSTITTA